MRRKRRGAPEAEFEDPLSDYSSPIYEDDLERTLMEDQVSRIPHQPFSSVSPSTTVEQAMRKMEELSIACMLIVENDRLKGIFSERDVLMKIVDQFERVKGQPVSEFMTVNPWVVYETDSPAKALNLMAVGGFRHLPILNVDDKVVGIIGPRRVTAYLQAQFS